MLLGLYSDNTRAEERAALKCTRRRSSPRCSTLIYRSVDSWLGACGDVSWDRGGQQEAHAADDLRVDRLVRRGRSRGLLIWTTSPTAVWGASVVKRKTLDSQVNYRNKATNNEMKMLVKTESVDMTRVVVGGDGEGSDELGGGVLCNQTEGFHLVSFTLGQTVSPYCSRAGKHP